MYNISCMAAVSWYHPQYISNCTVYCTVNTIYSNTVSILYTVCWYGIPPNIFQTALWPMSAAKALPLSCIYLTHFDDHIDDHNDGIGDGDIDDIDDDDNDDKADGDIDAIDDVKSGCKLSTTLDPHFTCSDMLIMISI